jgi:hypothetical protein
VVVLAQRVLQTPVEVVAVRVEMLALVELEAQV